MTNKIPKKLVQEFKQVVGITGAGSAYWQPELAHVIDLAAEWCLSHDAVLGMKIYTIECVARIETEGEILANESAMTLPLAIMTAVVSAAKGIKDGN